MNEYLSKKIKVLSFLSILAVIFYHVRPGAEVSYWSLQSSHGCINTFLCLFVNRGIACFAVPLFFLISGYLFFRNTTTALDCIKKWRTRFRTLFIPYLLWNTIWIGVVVGFVVLLYELGLLRYNSLAEIPLIAQMGGVKCIIEPYPAGQFWFIRDLIILVIISPIIFILTKRYGGLPIIILLIATITIYMMGWYDSDMNYGFSFMRSSVSLIFFMAAAYLALYRQNLVLKKRGVSSSIIWGVLWFIMLSVRTVNLVCLENGMLASLFLQMSTIVGVLFVWCIYDAFIYRYSNSLLISSLLPYTFWIFAFHSPSFNFVESLFLKVLGRTSMGFAMSYSLLPFLMIAICIVIAKLLQKLMPSFYNVLVGGRS